MRLQWLLMALCVSATANAHDLITADAAEDYVRRAQSYVATIKNESGGVIQRANGQLDLARMQDEIKELLNRDLAMHGKVQGLPSNALIERLRASGAPLPWSETLARFAAPLPRYESYIAAAPRGDRVHEALFGAVYGYFYESFRDDPLQTLSTDAKLLDKHIGYAERFLKDFPKDVNIEEVRFIAAILHLRAARAGTDTKAHAARAKELLVAFRKDYPESMRSAAVPVLLDAIPR